MRLWSGHWQPRAPGWALLGNFKLGHCRRLRAPSLQGPCKLSARGGEIAPRRTFCTRHWQLRVTAARVWTAVVKRTSACWVLAVLAPQWPK